MPKRRKKAKGKAKEKMTGHIEEEVSGLGVGGRHKGVSPDVGLL